MALFLKDENKLRIIGIYKVLYEYSDELHPITTNELIDILKNEYGISSHRTTITNDISILKEAGVDIETIVSSQKKYYIASRKFELPELTMLRDAVISSKSITAKKCKDLVKKLSSLASKYEAEELLSGFDISCEEKTKNEKIYYITDVINRAISENKKVSFRYYKYKIDGDVSLRQNGEEYYFSPYGMIRDGDFSYTVGYGDKRNQIVVFRIDRIADVPTILEEKAVEKPKKFDISRFRKTAFCMYGGDLKQIEICFDNALIGSVVDQFGTDIKIHRVDENISSIKAQVMVSPVFFSWIFGFGGRIKILYPMTVKEQYTKMIEDACNKITNNVK